MMRRIFFLTRWDLAVMMRHRETLMWMFVMPVLFMYVIGAMMGSGQEAATVDTLTVLDQDGGPVAADLMRHLRTMEYEIAVVADEATLNRAARQLTIPAGFSAHVLAAQPDSLRFRRRERGDLRAQLDQVRLNRALFAVLGDAILLAGHDSTDEGRLRDFRAGFGALAAKPEAIEVEVRSAGRRRIIPSGFQQSVPGTMVQFILMVMLTTGGTFIVIDRDQGLLRRLASSPYARGEIVAGKILSRFLIGVVQAAFAMLVGTLLFHVDWGGSILGVLAVIVLFCSTGAALSVLFGNLATSRGQAVGLGVLGGNILSALGGCWWPLEIVPPAMRTLGQALPTGWAMHGLHRLISFGDPFVAALPAAAALLGATLVFLLLAVRTFRYQ
ncbi:MAG: ABC transporter permease [Candidatus Eisenbacteria bacterium]